MAESVVGLPLVSIIVPVFNGERYLRESLDSILAQTYPRTEVLVMDDASTDATPSIAASYGNRVAYYRQPRNRGQFCNVNEGIAMVRGEYIAVYHADDVYDPRIVEREITFFQAHPELGAVFCKDIFIDPEGLERGRLELPPEVRGQRPLEYPLVLNALLKYKNRFLCCPTSMVRASVYREVGPYREDQFGCMADLEMWLRMARKYPLGIVEEYLLRYRQGHTSAITRYQRLRTDPEMYFHIVDLHLNDGGRHLVTPDALAAYEAHRAEDQLMLVITHYILGRQRETRTILSRLHPAPLLRSSSVQRGRLLVLFMMLQILVRLPRVSPLADMFYRRWHDKASIVRSQVARQARDARRRRHGARPSG
jgi:glycosyltransferase involved in cell wall biosynthesis